MTFCYNIYMCLSIPYKIKKITGSQATVESYDKKDRLIDIKLLEKIKIGDWVLILNNLAIEKIKAKEAQEIINLYKI